MNRTKPMRTFAKILVWLSIFSFITIATWSSQISESKVVLIQPNPISPVQGGTGVGVVLRGGSTSSSTGSSTVGIPPIYLPKLITHTANSFSVDCITYSVYFAPSRYDYQVELTYAQDLWSALLPRYPMCRSTTSATTNLGAYINNIWTKTYMQNLPVPNVTIPPGFGVVGIPSYVVTHFPFTLLYRAFTPYGQLTISALGSLDLTTRPTESSDGGRIQSLGPFFTPLQPWPLGTAVLNWGQPGFDSITASLTWSARWQLDGESGYFAPVLRQYNISNFQVEALQAVRVSSGQL